MQCKPTNCGSSLINNKIKQYRYDFIFVEGETTDCATFNYV